MISIHYKGKSEPQIMRNLILELKAISDEMHWKYTIVDDEKFIGILLTTMKKCEPLSLIINKDGKLIHPAWLNDENPMEAAFYVSTKTHFSSIDNHIVIVRLLKYIKKKYIGNLSVIDEGEYYETGNKELLKQKWNFLLKKLDEVTELLENNLSESDKDLSPENLVEKIESIIRRNYQFPEDKELI